jgi:hypothetical protein
MNLSKSSLSYQNILNGLKNSAKNIVWFLAQGAFFFILIFILLEILLGEFLFYQYVFLAKTKEPEVTTLPVRFKKEIYQSVVKEWESRENAFNATKRETYTNPFN